MQGQSHASQNVGEPLNSPDPDSQEAIRSPDGRTRTVGRFEDATLMWSFEAHIETLKQQLSRVEARAERQAAEFAGRAAQVAAEHTARIKALEGHIETLKAREGPTERVESQAAELAALIHTLKGQLTIGEARAERQAAEFAERAAQVAAEHAAQIKTLEERIETLKGRLSAAETQLAERATEHDANIAAERVKTEAEQAKAARAIPGNDVLVAQLREWANRPVKTEAEQAAELKEWEWDKRPWWRRIWRSGRAEIYGVAGGGKVSDALYLNPALYQPVTRDHALPSSASVAQAADLSGRARQESGSAERRQWQLPSVTFDRANRPADKGAFRPLGRRP
jgi:phage host-nuclease inhibitor protein Gam